MRIVIDMQGAQTESRFRGIGRYTLQFAQAVTKNRKNHDIILVLNGLFPDTIEPIRAAFHGILPQKNIRVWYASNPVEESDSSNKRSREAAEFIRESFIASLQPDLIHICSLFEGYLDNAVISIGKLESQTPTSVILYDLIPLVHPNHYLTPNPRYESFYRHKVNYFKKADVFLAISKYSQQEGATYLKVSESKITNISGSIQQCFHTLNIDEITVKELRNKFKLTGSFLLYTGGADERKNLLRLIQAYAAMPTHTKEKYQLLVAGKIPELTVIQLQQSVVKSGLEKDRVLFVGYITDDELVRLYNQCSLFVFPSWHEGLGLPVLEAMSCGAQVIAANATSLPEVIGLQEALFDPFDIHDISTKMQQALEDDRFRARLRKHGLQQTKKFSWKKTAKRAIKAWESLPETGTAGYLNQTLAKQRLYEALTPYISTIVDSELIALSGSLAQNQQNGIERQLLLDISELFQRDAASGVQRVVRGYLKWLLESPPTGFRVEPVYATTTSNGYKYARQYTKKFLGLKGKDEIIDEPICWQRGDIFFGLDMQHHVQLTHKDFYRLLHQDGVIIKFLVHDLLPIQLADLFSDINTSKLHAQWLDMIARMDGAICVSSATAEAFKLWIAKNSIQQTPNFQLDWVHIGGDRESSMPSQGLPVNAPQVLKEIRNRPSFLCVSTIEPRKKQQQILEAVERLWASGVDINLVFVGSKGWKVDDLANKIQCHPEQQRRLFWLQGISDEYLDQVYTASTCLIAASINEGFGLPLIEAAQHNLPILARDIPVFREVAEDYAYYFSGDTPSELADALKTWLALYRNGHQPLTDQMRWSTWHKSTEKLKTVLVENNYPHRQLLVDISELVQHDAKTGIQRVVRNILKNWLANPPSGFRVEPVFATIDQPYRYARRFTNQFLGAPNAGLEDDIIDYSPGDVFFGLDLQPQVQTAKKDFYMFLRRQGVSVKFMVYDLLCIQLPMYFPLMAGKVFADWLAIIKETDGAICISKAVADELSHWVQENSSGQLRPFAIDWFHLGADVESSVSTKVLPNESNMLLNKLREHPSFLMVSTLEPRKGHTQVLNAFEKLWDSNADVNLVLVGQQGWMVEKLVARLMNHPESNKRLLWLNDINDDYLEEIYSASTCLIAASYGEGFGLPLIEAAQHNLPIIARDIPVFREVAGEHAFYFCASKPKELMCALKEWLALYKEQRHPESSKISFFTWKESAIFLQRVVTDQNSDEKHKEVH